MAQSIDKLLLDHKPSLVVWQTGTYDAVRGTDPEEFRASVSDGVEKLHEGGADVVLVNMQYSPRTESIVAISAYADGLKKIEAITRKLAADHGLKVIGGFDPRKVGCDASEYIDAEHSNAQCLQHIFDEFAALDRAGSAR